MCVLSITNPCTVTNINTCIYIYIGHREGLQNMNSATIDSMYLTKSWFIEHAEGCASFILEKKKEGERNPKQDLYLTKSLVESWDIDQTSVPAIKLENMLTKHVFYGIFNLENINSSDRSKRPMNQRDGYVKELKINTENNIKKVKKK